MLQCNRPPCRHSVHSYHLLSYCSTSVTLHTQHTSAHCNTLQHTATHFSTLQHTSAHCNTLQHPAPHFSTLQHTSAHCNILVIPVVTVCTSITLYGVATISRPLKITGFFCKKALQKRLYSAKETYDFEESTHRSHPIGLCSFAHTTHFSTLQHTATDCNTLQQCYTVLLYTHIHTYRESDRERERERHK